MRFFKEHPRTFAANHYVYPVLSRRAGGVSIGVNLNADQVCNFHCIYCQVDRSTPLAPEEVDLHRLADELDSMTEAVLSGRIFEGPRFRDTPLPLRRLNDIALSGEGEPTSSGSFEQVVALCADARRRLPAAESVKLVLITNASLFHLPRVQRGLAILDISGGEIWAKLDAGTEDYYRLVNRSGVPWPQILDNLREAARARPIVIQSLFLKIRGEPPATAEIDAYGDRLAEVLSAGGRIKLVQVHTIARVPTEAWATGLSEAELIALAETIGRRTGLSTAVFP